MRHATALLGFAWLAILPGAQFHEPAWPKAAADAAEPTTVAREDHITSAGSTWQGRIDSPLMTADALIRKIPVCIAWTHAWAGDLGSSVLYRVQHISDNRIQVGYFAYWTTERPWGNNNLTRWVLPAVAIDAVYSHLLFVFPGLQRLIYGAGDVEGVRVLYRVETDRLVPESIVADDETHTEVSLRLDEAVDEHGQIMLLDAVWSHQLGARQALQHTRAGAPHQCFHNESLLPLTHQHVAEFRLGSPETPLRAGPAWGTALHTSPSRESDLLERTVAHSSF